MPACNFFLPQEKRRSIEVDIQRKYEAIALTAACFPALLQNIEYNS
jgi:hypothetical protein